MVSCWICIKGTAKLFFVPKETLNLYKLDINGGNQLFYLETLDLNRLQKNG